MKNIGPILFFLTFLIITPTKSQEYIPMAVEGAHWIVALDHIDTPWLVDDLWEYYAEGDTILSGETFKKIYYRPLIVTQDPPPFVPEGEYQLIGFIRDDTLERKVFAIHLPGIPESCPVGEEFVLYDFSVSTNDTAFFCLIPEFEPCPIDTILQSTYLGFDTYLYQLFCISDSYFEGLGSWYGLFEPMFAPFKSSRYILSTYLYYYCRESPCDLIVSVPEIQPEAYSMQIFPNPVRDIININFSSTILGGEIQILNLFGQLVDNINTEPEIKEYYFDLSSFPSGNYFVVYAYKGEVIAREQVVMMK